MSTDNKLSDEAKTLIRSFLLKTILPSGIALTVISFILGFVAKDYGSRIAYDEAMEEYRKKITEAYVEAESARTKANDAKHNLTEVEELLKTSSELARSNQNIHEISDIIKSDHSFMRSLISQSRSWEPISTDGSPFLPDCEYRYQILSDGHEYENGYYYPTLVTPENMYLDYSGQHQCRVNYKNKSKDSNETKIQLYRRCR